jgi:hypothetical protein
VHNFSGASYLEKIKAQQGIAIEIPKGTLFVYAQVAPLSGRVCLANAILS